MCQQFCESQMFHTYTFNVATELEVKKGSSYQFEKDLYTFVQNHPRGIVEQLSFGFSSVLSKYKARNGPEVNTNRVNYADSRRETSSPTTTTATPQPRKALPPPPPTVTAQSLASVPAPPNHELSDVWNESPENIPFDVIHELFSPVCDKQNKGVLFHKASALPLIEFQFSDTNPPSDYLATKPESSLERLANKLHPQLEAASSFLNSLLDAPNQGTNNENRNYSAQPNPSPRNQPETPQWTLLDTKLQSEDKFSNVSLPNSSTVSLPESKVNLDLFKDFNISDNESMRNPISQAPLVQSSFDFGEFKSTNGPAFIGNPEPLAPISYQSAPSLQNTKPATPQTLNFDINSISPYNSGGNTNIQPSMNSSDFSMFPSTPKIVHAVHSLPQTETKSSPTSSFSFDFPSVPQNRPT